MESCFRCSNLSLWHEIMFLLQYDVFGKEKRFGCNMIRRNHNKIILYHVLSQLISLMNSLVKQSLEKSWFGEDLNRIGFESGIQLLLIRYLFFTDKINAVSYCIGSSQSQKTLHYGNRNHETNRSLNYGNTTTMRHLSVSSKY